MYKDTYKVNDVEIIVVEKCEQCGLLCRQDGLTVFFDTGIWWRMCKRCAAEQAAIKAGDRDYIRRLLLALCEAKHA